MIYINVFNGSYKRLISFGRLCVRVLLLGWNESVIDDITDICDLSQSHISLRSGESRFSGSLVIHESALEYSLSLRKIKILVGVTDGTDAYYYSMGVMYISAVSTDGDIITLTLIDKFDILKGNTKLCYESAQLQIPGSEKLYLLDDAAIAAGNGIKIGNCIRDLLSTPIGNGLLLDPVMPLIDKEFDDISLEKQIVIGGGFYPGAAIREIAQTYMYNTYYDRDGHLKVERSLEDDRYYLSPSWEFGEDEMTDFDLSFDDNSCINAQRVTGTDINGCFHSFTAYNNNPRSPLRTSLIGIRRADDVEIANGNSDRKCEMYARYLLRHKTAACVNARFSSLVIPHILPDRPIVLPAAGKRERYIVSSVNIPLGGGNMSVEAASVEYLPTEEGNHE